MGWPAPESPPLATGRIPPGRTGPPPLRGTDRSCAEMSIYVAKAGCRQFKFVRPAIGDGRDVWRVECTSAMPRTAARTGSAKTRHIRWASSLSSSGNHRRSSLSSEVPFVGRERVADEELAHGARPHIRTLTERRCVVGDVKVGRKLVFNRRRWPSIQPAPTGEERAGQPPGCCLRPSRFPRPSSSAESRSRNPEPAAALRSCSRRASGPVDRGRSSGPGRRARPRLHDSQLLYRSTGS